VSECKQIYIMSIYCGEVINHSLSVCTVTECDQSGWVLKRNSPSMIKTTPFFCTLIKSARLLPTYSTATKGTLATRMSSSVRFT